MEIKTQTELSIYSHRKIAFGMEVYLKEKQQITENEQEKIKAFEPNSPFPNWRKTARRKGKGIFSPSVL